MGLFKTIFGKRPPEPERAYEGTFKMLNGYTPKFTSYSGGIYESELVRSAINARATHISKLAVDVIGTAKPALRNKLKHAPNQFQTWSQFLYRLSTILDVNNSAFICPVWDEYGEISGIYAPLPDRCEIVQYAGAPYLRYEFARGKKAAVEFDLCGVLTKFQYRSDFFGENNRALIPTMDLIHIQDQGIKEGVKSAASYRFIAKLANFSRPEDLAKERKRFTIENLSADADGGGLLLFPSTYNDIQQVKTSPFTIDADQMAAIKGNVYQYFGVNEDILTNRAFGDAWAAFYEGAIEPFAVQLADVLSKMLFSLRERSQGNSVAITSNRLQYMSNADKLAVSAQLLDRGLLSLNEAREIWNMPPIDGGDAHIIRGEYYNAGDRVNGGNSDD